MYPYRSKDTPLHHPLVSNGSDFLTTSAPVGRIAKYCTIQQCRFLQAFCLKKNRGSPLSFLRNRSETFIFQRAHHCLSTPTSLAPSRKNNIINI